MGCTNKAPSIQALLEHALSHALLITPCHKCRKTGSPCVHRQAQLAAFRLSPGVRSDVAGAGVSVPALAKGSLRCSQGRQGLSLPSTAASFTRNMNACGGESSPKPAHPITSPITTRAAGSHSLPAHNRAACSSSKLKSGSHPSLPRPPNLQSHHRPCPFS